MRGGRDRRKTMCTNGVNTGQFENMIEQIDDHVKLERRWAHTLGPHRRRCRASPPSPKKLHAAQALLDDVRAMLDEAQATRSRRMPEAAGRRHRQPGVAGARAEPTYGTGSDALFRRHARGAPRALRPAGGPARPGQEPQRGRARPGARRAGRRRLRLPRRAEVVGTLTIAFDHHATDLQEKLHSIQHDLLRLHRLLHARPPRPAQLPPR